MKKFLYASFLLLSLLIIKSVIAAPSSGFWPSSCFGFGSAGEEYAGKAHNCRMWAAISNGMPQDLIVDDLFLYPASLKFLSQLSNLDGWGIASYQELLQEPVIKRGALRAFNDSLYGAEVNRLNHNRPDIIMAHIRNCSSGCCCQRCETIPDPHPFCRYSNGRYWTFVHNGAVDKNRMYGLIGSEYLRDNPPTGSGIAECEPVADSLVIDSELYFIFLMKHIDQCYPDPVLGIVVGLKELMASGESRALNFIMSDGNDIYAFRRGETLFYIYNPVRDYSAVASRYPDYEQGNWIEVNDNELVILRPGRAPLIMFIESPDNNQPPLIALPTEVEMLGNFPNPFNSATAIKFNLPRASTAKIEIYNLLGQRVFSIPESSYPAGMNSIIWNASGFPSGVYFYKFISGRSSFSRRMTLLK